MAEFENSDILHIHLLSRLVLAPDMEAEALETAEYGADLCATADAHHVLVRAGSQLKNLQNIRSKGVARPGRLRLKGFDGFDTRLTDEQARIAALMERLPTICSEMEASGIRVAIIKSLDHWPDFGSDIDLFTDAPERRVSLLMRSRFEAEIVSPTLGDRLANKVNYRIPGLNELVEVHFGRLGQTGEHVELARRVLDRCRIETFNGVPLPVPAPAERLIIATLQRMYRHFYLRICDIVNTASIVESGDIDFDELRHAAKAAGIWSGVATYLELVSQYVEHYRGNGLRLPYWVSRAAQFGLTKVYPNAGFLRLPLFPQAASLYTRQLAKSFCNDPVASLRLSLLPPLAAAAGAKFKITGSDKGVW